MTGSPTVNLAIRDFRPSKKLRTVYCVGTLGICGPEDVMVEENWLTGDAACGLELCIVSPVIEAAASTCSNGAWAALEPG